jgi:L-asparaginase II
MRIQLEVQIWRGSIAESRHRLQLAVCDPDGRLHAGTEAPATVTTFRSAAKPFQMLPLVERGHADHFGLSEVDLAVMAASHTGTDAHLELVKGILARVDCTEADLACGFHEPVDETALRSFRENRLPPSRLYNNCSGKHAGMLAMCRAEKWPIAGYAEAGHPLQQLLHQTVSDVCGLPVERVGVAIDGCSACVFAMPLTAMARGFARLAAASETGDAREKSLARIRRAMSAHPWAVGGKSRFSTTLMESIPELVAKGGAEGLECVGWPARQLGLALKCEDGATRAVAPALVLVLEQLGALHAENLERLGEWRRPRLTNYAGLDVGTVSAELRVLAGSAG